MDKQLLILSNRDLFTIFSSSFLEHYPHQVLNLRYSNERFSPSDHTVYQLKKLYEHLYLSDSSKEEGISPFYFSFHSDLTYRIDRVPFNHPIRIIFFEMTTFEQSEWSLLSYLKEAFDGTIVVFLHQTRISVPNLFSRLLKLGVRETITEWNPAVFENIVKRNLSIPNTHDKNK